MERLKINGAPLSVRVLLTMVIMGAAITYMILALHIFIDTSFKVSLIKDAYKDMDWTELVDHTHKYFPYYGIYIFSFTLFTFVLGTSYPEWAKILMTIVPSVLIVLDIGSMWAIRFINADIFSWVLFLAGLGLAASFGLLSSLSLFDIWLRKSA